jgi:hypothetical protein
MNYYLIGVAFIFVFLSKYISGANGKLSNYNFTGDSMNLSDVEKNDYITIQDFVYNLLKKYDSLNTPLPFNLIYSVVFQESSKQIIKGMPNNLIEGYDGKSIGFFQVTKWSVAEYNQREKPKNPLTYADCYNEYENFLVGMCYLYYCFNSAKGDIFLTAKKYNGGIDETSSSKNSMATEYANKIVKRFNIYKSIEKK